MTARWKSESGAVALMTAFAMVPLLGLVGLSVDAGRAYLVQSRLAQALDAAALAGGRVMFDENRDADVQAFFNANFPAGTMGAQVSALTISADSNGENLTVSASATLGNTLMRFLGFETMAIPAASVVHRAAGGVELALVMDNTGSMASGGKIATMKAGAADLVDILYGDRETIPNVWVSLIPYAATVNMGAGHQDWLSPTSRTNLKSDFAASPQGWKGCVEARWTLGRDMTDDPPAVERWGSFKYPRNAQDNNYPPVDESAATNTTGNEGKGPNLGCPPPVTPLLAEKSRVKAAIAAMGAWHRGGTMANLGLAWGWRTLSPRWRALWSDQAPQLPLDYHTPYSNKVVVLLTDGVNEVFDYNTRDSLSSDYTAYGRLSDGHMGSTNKAQATANIDAKMAGVCQSMKQLGITLYTITYDLTDPGTKALFRGCASKPEYYYDATDNSRLRQIFRQIGVSISKLRIAR